MGVNICHNKDQKVHCEEPKSQDIYLRLLVKPYRFLPRFKPTPPSSGAEEVVHELLSQMVRNMKLPGQEGKTTVDVGTIIYDVCVQEVSRLEELHLEPHSQGWGQNPQFRLAGPGYPPRDVVLFCFWSLQGPHSVKAFWQGPRSPSQPHQTLRMIQGLEVQTHKRLTGYPWVQKMNPRS